jgi:hypothetical protein
MQIGIPVIPKPALSTLSKAADMTDRTIISYIRVYTSQQGRSGLGIEASGQP